MSLISVTLLLLILGEPALLHAGEYVCTHTAQLILNQVSTIFSWGGIPSCLVFPAHSESLPL